MAGTTVDPVTADQTAAAPEGAAPVVAPTPVVPGSPATARTLSLTDAQRAAAQRTQTERPLERTPFADLNGMNQVFAILLMMFLGSSTSENNQELLSMISDLTGIDIADVADLQTDLHSGRRNVVDVVRGMSFDEASLNDQNNPESAFAQRLNTTGFSTWFNSARALSTSRSDDATSNECARGVGNVLEAQGINVTNLRAHATDWDENLRARSDFTFVPCRFSDLRNIPDGAIIVYNNNAEAGRGVLNNGRGAQYGHVEIKSTVGGQPVFISDTARQNPGGSVRENFVGGYFMYDPQGEVRQQLMAAQSQTPAPGAATASPPAPSTA
jgi:hypothetical protein